METSDGYAKIIKTIESIISKYKSETFGIVSMYPTNVSILDNFYEKFKDKISDFLIVSNSAKKRKDLDITIVKDKLWKEKETSFMEKTRNSFLIINKLILGSVDFSIFMEKIKSYYPAVFIFIDQEQDFVDEDISGWVKVSYPAEDLVLFCNTSLSSFESFDFGGNVSDIIGNRGVQSRNKLSEKKGREVDISYDLSTGFKPVTEIKPKGISFEIFDSLPTPTISPPDKESSIWRREFYTYLKEILTRITPPGKVKLVDFILNKRTIAEIWIPVFTSDIVNPDPQLNYDTFETIGDASMKSYFLEYIKRRHVDSTPAQLNNWKNSYLSTEFQSEIGTKMGLHKWCFLPEVLRNNARIAEDLIEAFFGGLEEALRPDNTSSYPKIIGKIFFDQIFRNFEFPQGNETPKKTYIQQLIERISTIDSSKKRITFKKPHGIDSSFWEILRSDIQNKLDKEGYSEFIIGEEDNKKENGFTEKSYTNANRKYVTEIYINNVGSDALKKLGVKIKAMTLIGSGVDPTKAPSSTKAYIDAAKNIEKYGVTEQWANEKSIEKHTKNLDNIDIALQKAKRKNKDIFIIDVKNVKTLKNDQVFQVSGIDKNGNKHVLSTHITGTGGNNFQEAINKYLND